MLKKIRAEELEYDEKHKSDDVDEAIQALDFIERTIKCEGLDFPEQIMLS